MNKAFKKLYEEHQLMEHWRDAVSFLDMLEDHGFILDDLSKDKLDELMAYLINQKKNTIKNIIVLMRYLKVTKQNDTYIYLTQFTGMIGVLESILGRLKSINSDVYERINKAYTLPLLGTKPKDLSKYTNHLMELLNQYLSEEEQEKVLTGNNHNLSEKTQLNEKIEYEASDSLASYLKERHKRKVKELQGFMDRDEIWFEQKITKEVLDYVKSNQEILSGRLIDNAIYITKIPYDTVNFLAANNLEDRQYYSCHCPFARESIKSNHIVNQRFCYCSAGFAKFPFEVILGQKLKVEVLESALGQSDICRFKIDLNGIDYKK